MTILIIDDSKSDIDLLKHFLQKYGYKNIITAMSVNEGLASLNHDVKLVLMDVIMPEIDGIRGCAMIREREQYLNLPIIMVTSDKNINTLEAAFRAGANDYITKPFNKLELIARIRAALNLKAEIDKRKNRELELEKLNERLSELTQQLKEKNLMLQELTVIDPLTGIANRRRFDEALAKIWKRMQRNRLPISLIMLDIDNFKAYNDNYGHQKGDLVLKKVAKAIEKGPQRTDDIVARYGGEEFAVILPNTSKEGAINIAMQIKENIRQLQIKHEFSGVKDILTISMGVSSFLQCHDLTSEQLIERADLALYQSKNAGGDGIYVFECN